MSATPAVIVPPYSCKLMTRLEIKGWSGGYKITETEHGSQVIIFIPKRDDSEQWTWGPSKDGTVIVVSTSLLKKPHLLSITTDPTGEALVMEIIMPYLEGRDLDIVISPL